MREEDQKYAVNAPERGAANGAFTWLPGFVTGFLISLFLYVTLRLIGAKWIFNILTTLIMGYALLGTACGALIHARVRRALFIRYEPWLFVLALFHFFCIAYNYNLSSTYLVPVNGFSLYTPEKLGWHIAAEAVVFVLLPVIFVLPGYYFADCFSRAATPFGTYAAHVLGFFFGGLAGYFGVLQWGAAAGLGAGIIILLLFPLPRRLAYSLLFMAAAGAVIVYSFHAPKLFFTWSNREYKHLESTWSPHFKLDFISFDNDHCIAGVYNNLFLYYTCDTPAKAHLQVRQIYKEVARNRKRILVIGGSLGTAMSYMTRFQDKMEQGVSVEIDPVVAQRSVTKYAKYSGYALNRPDVKVLAMDGRRFVDEDKHKYDLIFLDGLDNALYFAPGSLVAVENYMFTREGLASLFDRLSPHGVVTMDLGGTTDVDYIGQYLAELPKDVKYELFWYVVPDRPMVGLALYFVVASRDPAALKHVTDHVKSLSSVVYVPYRPGKPRGPAPTVPTDNHPIIQSFDRLADILAVAFSLLFVISALVWRFRYKAKHGAPSTFPLAVFAGLGFVYIYAEFAVVLRHARLFSGPALGVVMLSSVFLIGNFIVNAAFVWLRRVRGSALTLAGIVPALIAFGIMYQNARNSMPTPAGAVGFTLAAGMAAGWFWPLLLHLMPHVDRRYAFAADTLGAMAGCVVFFFNFLGRGFPLVSCIAAAGFLVLLIYIILRIHPGAHAAGE